MTDPVIGKSQRQDTSFLPEQPIPGAANDPSDHLVQVLYHENVFVRPIATLVIVMDCLLHGSKFWSLVHRLARA